jgi:hypothetical protein
MFAERQKADGKLKRQRTISRDPQIGRMKIGPSREIVKKR